MDGQTVAYEAPLVQDYGDLTELTEAVSPCGALDGGSFEQPNHHTGTC